MVTIFVSYKIHILVFEVIKRYVGGHVVKMNLSLPSLVNFFYLFFCLFFLFMISSLLWAFLELTPFRPGRPCQRVERRGEILFRKGTVMLCKGLSGFIMKNLATKIGHAWLFGVIFHHKLPLLMDCLLNGLVTCLCPRVPCEMHICMQTHHLSFCYNISYFGQCFMMSLIRESMTSP